MFPFSYHLSSFHLKFIFLSALFLTDLSFFHASLKSFLPLTVVLRCSVPFSTGFLSLLGLFGHCPAQRSALRDVTAGEQTQSGGCENISTKMRVCIDMMWFYESRVRVCVCRCSWIWPVWSLRSSSVWRFYWERSQEPSSPSCRPRRVLSSSLTKTPWSVYIHTLK